MANTTVNNIPINGSFDGAEPVFDGATTGVTYLSLTESGLVGGVELQTIEVEISPEEEAIEAETGDVLETIPATITLTPGFGRPVADDTGTALAPTLCPVPDTNYNSLMYGEFDDSAITQLYEDLCTACAEQTFSATICEDGGVATGAGEPDGADPGAASSRAFAHYASMAIAGFINQLEFEIELHADTAAAAVASDTFTSTVSVAGSAAAQTGTGTGVASTDISAAIEASTFTITISTK
jgi:hypothetical protein